jgi:hypothetical protein
MNTAQIDLLVGGAFFLLYLLYVLVRVFQMRDTGWFLKLLASAAVLLFPIVGALFVHLLICQFAAEPRDDRFLGALGLAGSFGAFLAYASTFAHFAVHDVYPLCLILLGFAGFLVFAPFFLRIPSALQRDWKVGFLSVYPKWAMVLALATVLNTFVHLGVYNRYAEYGVPRERSGSYYLEINDRRIREITKEEYYAFSGYFVRGLSSTMLAFFLVPALFYLWRRRDSPDETAVKPTAADASHQRPNAL